MNNYEECYILISRFHRERRKWIRKMKGGTTVFVTSNNKKPYQVIFTKNEEFDNFIKTIGSNKRSKNLRRLMSSCSPWE